MGTLRRFAQGLGLVYRNDGTWRPLGFRTPLTTRGSRSDDDREHSEEFKILMGQLKEIRGHIRELGHKIAELDERTKNL